MGVDLAHIPLLIAAGFIAGLLNVVAGGGSFLTLPILIYSGLSADVANGTNRVAVVVQAAVATRGLSARESLNLRLYLTLLPPLALGAASGAWLATQINPDQLKVAFGLLFLAIGLRSLWRWPKTSKPTDPRPATAALPASSEGQQPPPRLILVLRYPIVVLIGVYGGFLQAGVGLWVVLAACAFFSANLREASGVKMPLVLSFTLPALAIFASARDIEPVRAGLLALGTALGAAVGVRVLVRSVDRLVQLVVALAMILTGGFLLL